MRRPQDSGFTLIELLIVLAIVSLMAAVAMPSVARARMSANASSAVAALKIIGLGELEYAASCGNDGFAVAFTVLATAPSGVGAPFVPADLSAQTPVKAGYVFSLSPGAGGEDGPLDCAGTLTQTSYAAAAVPVAYGATGEWSYAITPANLVWQLASPTAPVEPFGSPATPVR